MTTLGIEAPALPRTCTWVQVSEDLWTANTGSDFIGTVERIGDRYLAVDDHGMPLGTSATLELAKLRLLRGPGRAAARWAEAEDDERLARITAWVAGLATVAAVIMLLAGYTS